MAPGIFSWVPTLLIEKGRCLTEDWKTFRSSSEEDSF